MIDFWEKIEHNNNPKEHNIKYYGYEMFSFECLVHFFGHWKSNTIIIVILFYYKITYVL